MLHPYTWVVALQEGVWTLPSRHLVRVLVERATWQINGVGTEVEHGLVVGFNRQEDAEYFLNVHTRYEQPRCERVSVVPGMFVCFHTTADAFAVVDAGVARISSEDEAYESYRRAVEQGQQVEPDDSAAVTQPVDEPEQVVVPIKKSRRTQK